MNKSGNGTLLLTGAASTSPLFVNAGTLGGGFGTSGTITMNGGTLEPGISGTLSTITSTSAGNAVVFAAASTLNFDCGSTPSNDKIVGTGLSAFDFGTQADTLNINVKPGFGPGNYTLIDNMTFPNTPPSVPSNTVPGVSMTLTVQTGSAGGASQKLVLGVTAQGGSIFWTGSAGDHKWSTPGNWLPNTNLSGGTGRMN